MKDYIPAKYRRPIYGVFAFIGLALGAVQIGFMAANAGQPMWLTVALAVYPFVGAGIGFTAQANTTDEPTRRQRDVILANQAFLSDAEREADMQAALSRVAPKHLA